MSEQKPSWDDQQLELVVGNLLRAGVLLSAAVVLFGGVIFLLRHGGEEPDVRTFHGVPGDLTHPVEIVKEAFSGSGRGMIQLGLLLLIATPVVRVAYSAYAFARERDRVYVIITLIVLTVLLSSLFAGYFGLVPK